MAKSKYYLRVNETIITFNHITGLENIDEFANLNVFTGCFTNKSSLIKQLKKWYLIPENLYKVNLSITRRTGNEEDEYTYNLQNFKIVYSSSLAFMDLNVIKNFLVKNIRNLDFIENFSYFFQNIISTERNVLDLYADKNNLMDRMKPKIDYLNMQLINLNSLIDYSTAYKNACDENDSEAKNYYLEYFKNSLSKFLEYYLVSKSKDKNKIRDNYKNLSIMATFITSELSKSENLINVMGTKKYDEQKKEYKEIIGKMLPKRKVPLLTVEEVSEEEKEDYEEFLEYEDFERLPFSSPQLKESREVLLENFEERKKRTHR